MTTEQANQLQFIYTHISKFDMNLVNNVIEVVANDTGTWTTQTIETPLDIINAFILNYVGRYQTTTILNFEDSYSAGSGWIWKDGGSIKIKYATNGYFNCGDGTGIITIRLM